VYRNRTHRRIGVVALALALAAPAAAFAQPDASPACKPESPSAIALREVPEASGLTTSRASADRLYAINDSGTPAIFALDAKGAVVSRIQVSGAAVDDWEAIGAGACPSGTCLYIADIGDNNARRTRVTIYRMPEPAGGGSIAVSDVFHATYPDGPHDAETLLVTPDGDLFIVTKGETGPVGLYKFPRELRTGTTHTLERIGETVGSRVSGRADRITDGAVSPDGKWVALRTRTHVTFHRLADLTAGRWQETRRVDLTSLGEAQGEGVAFGPGDTLYLAGEGGGKARPGTFVRLTCHDVRAGS